MFKKFVICYDHRVDKKYVETAKKVLKELGIEFLSIDDDGVANDYPILAKKCHDLFLSEKADGMILMCGTGIGMNVCANKFDGIRSVLPSTEAEAYFARSHENANSIVFGAGYSDSVYEVKLCRRKMERILKTFLTADFGGGRHQRRVDEISVIERGENFND